MVQIDDSKISMNPSQNKNKKFENAEHFFLKSPITTRLLTFLFGGRSRPPPDRTVATLYIIIPVGNNVPGMYRPQIASR